MEANLLNPDTSTLAVEKALSNFGKLDILVNVAGISGRRFGDGPVHEASDEGWDMVMDTNAKTTFQMCRAALGPMMAQRSGAIVNIASVLAYAPAVEFLRPMPVLPATERELPSPGAGQPFMPAMGFG